MNIAVCDDEENIRCLIKKLIEKQSKDCQIMEFSSGRELLHFWRQKDREQIDILFLDISMDGADGMETAEQIRDWKVEKNEPLWGGLPLLIFVTGYPEYMPKAFSVNAFQYLVKPIDEREFEDALKKALRECRYLEAKKNTEPREILIRNGNVTRKVPAIFIILRAITGKLWYSCKMRKSGATERSVRWRTNCGKAFFGFTGDIS